MLRRIVRVSAPLTLLFPALAALAGGCGGRDVTVAIADESEVPVFTAPDGDAGVDAAEAGLVSYCPSDKCPEGWTTCPTSRFRCDVNLLTDRNNCGECGYVCPQLGRGNATYECSEGACVMACGSPPENIDCDGIPDNGCETVSTTNENCGGCGITCPDPDRPCVATNAGIGCGCPGGLIYCTDPNTGEGTCVDPKTDDLNCGACNNACNPAGDGSTPPSNAVFGCVDRKCDQLKCQPFYMDCDNDLSKPESNGCEASSWSKENCGSCGNTCAAGMECQGNLGFAPTCSCPTGQTYCGYLCLPMGDTEQCFVGVCADLGSDRKNCGSCFHECPVANTLYSVPVCDYGMCARQCIRGRADCNGNPDDDCEVDTDSDPQNCGACGVACDASIGQACVGGRCVVEPCDESQVDGGLTR